MSDFHKTAKQHEATKLLAGPAKNIMLFGGSRSGKTFLLTHSLIIRASKVQSRHAILRQNFNHAKRSIWRDTLPKVLRLAFPSLRVKWNNTDFFITFANGSEIWIGGLDDKERTEKILGTEYSTMWFNECSQMDYSSVQLARTRLAEKNDLIKRTYYDQNPPKKNHWSYWLFEKKIDPIDEVPITDPENYVSMLMNPNDNIENIDAEYLAMLEKMPEKERNRFLHGMYNDESDGQVYYSFRRDEHVGETKIIPGTIFSGHDFNVSPMTALVAQYYDGKFWIHDELWLENSDTYKMCAELKKKGFSGTRAIPDSTGRNRKTSGQTDFKIMQDSGMTIESTHNPFVTDRVNNVNRLFQADKIVINPKCRKLINDLEKVSWKNNDIDAGPDKMLGHITDCLGYICWKLDPFSKISMKIEQQTIR